MPGPSTSKPDEDEDDDVDKSLAHIGSHAKSDLPSKKGRVQQIEWDAELEEMSREKAAAEATRGKYRLSFDAECVQIPHITHQT